MAPLLMSMEWLQGKQGETKYSTKNQWSAVAAINQASAEFGFTKPMVDIAYAQAREREWYADFKDSKLDVRKDPNSERRSLDDTYGIDRLRGLWREAVKVNKDWASFRDLAGWIAGHSRMTLVPLKLSSTLPLR
jgi:hypothetical protein